MKKKNYAKRHENTFRESCKKIDGVIIERLYDTMGGRVNLRQPSDFICYRLPHIFYVECKTTKETQLQMSNISDFQWKSLNERSKVNGCIAGILVEFRVSEDEIKVFFIEIDDLNNIKNREGKKYIDIEEATQIGIEIPTKKKKVNFSYDMKKFFNNFFSAR